MYVLEPPLSWSFSANLPSSIRILTQCPKYRFLWASCPELSASQDSTLVPFPAISTSDLYLQLNAIDLHIGRKPTSATSETKVNVAQGSMPWQTSSSEGDQARDNFKYTPRSLCSRGSLMQWQVPIPPRWKPKEPPQGRSKCSTQRHRAQCQPAEGMSLQLHGR